jgi:CheY-like chemotaxis protein
LVVDDEPTVLRAWTRQLEHAGFDVLTAQSARDAIGTLARAGHEIDSIICDLHMPVGGGIELYRFLVAEHPGMHHRVVFTTGGVFSASESEFLRMTGQPVLEKPVVMEELMAIARDWATRRRRGLDAGESRSSR